MARKAKAKRKRAPKTILKLPDLEQSKSARPQQLDGDSHRRRENSYTPHPRTGTGVGSGPPARAWGQGACHASERLG